MRIPTSQNQAQDSPLPTARRAALQDTRGESIGRGLGAVGDQIAAIQIEEKRKADSSAVFEADLGLSEASNKAVQAAKSVKGKDVIGITDKLLPEFDKVAAEREKGIVSNRAKLIFQQQMQQRRQQLSGQLNEIEGRERENYYQAQQIAYREQEQNSAGLSYRDPKAIAESLERQDASIGVQLSGQSDEVKAAARAENRAKTYSRVFDQMIADEDLTRAKSYFGAVKDDMDSETMVRVKSSINALEARKASEARALQAERRSLLGDEVRDAFAMRQLGMPAVLPSRNSFIAAYGEDGAKRYQAASQQWQAYDAAGNAAMMPPAEALQYLSSLKPTTQEGAADTKAGYDLAVSLYAQQRQRLEADPVDTLIRTRPELARLQEQADAGEIDKGTYFRKLLATQRTLGVQSPRLLSESQREGLAKVLDFDPEQPKARAAAIAGFKQEFGDSYLSVMREVAPKLEGQARVMVDMSPDQAARLDVAMAQKSELDTLVKGDDAKAINEQLDNEFEDLSITLADNADAEARLVEFRNAALLLAKADVLRGTDPQEAARKAAAAVVNDQYNYVGTMRIPRAYDPDAVSGGAALAKNQLAKSGDLVIAGNESAQKDLQSVIRRQGYWVTNEDGTGLVLRIPARTGQGNVYKKDGSRVEYTWDQLKDMESADSTPSWMMEVPR